MKRGKEKKYNCFIVWVYGGMVWGGGVEWWTV